MLASFIFQQHKKIDFKSFKKHQQTLPMSQKPQYKCLVISIFSI